MKDNVTDLYLPTEVLNHLLPKVVGKVLVLPEYKDQRVQDAAAILASRFGIRVVMPSQAEIAEHARESLLNLVALAQQRGKNPNRISEDMAKNPLYYAGLMVEKGMAHAVVAGATVPTGDVIRAALATVGVNPRLPLISSAFLMALRQATPGKNSLLIFADCGVNPQPNSQQLANIAEQAVLAFSCWLKLVPKVAFLSFATAGSANHPDVDKVRAGHELFAAQHPNVLSEGEVQFDAAIVPEIAMLKNPASKVQGEANVLIFPDLDAGNIAYKVAQRLAGAQAYGPILLGTAKPFSDLSRGASVADIVGVALLTLGLVALG